MANSFLQIFLGLTYSCNLNCAHCYAKGRRTKNEMSNEQLKTLIDQISDLGVFKIVLSHGENLLRRDFFDILSYIKSKGMHLTVITNGTMVTRDIAERLKEVGTDKVLVSIDSSDPEKHDSNRGLKGTWLKAETAMRLIKESGIRTTMAVTVTPSNSGEVEALVKMGLGLGIDEISFLTVRQTGHADGFIFQKQVYDALIKEIWSLREQFMGKIELLMHDPLAIPALLDSGYAPTDDLVGLNMCGAGRLFLSIDPEGNVRPCNFIDQIIGNVKTETLDNICKSKTLKHFTTTPLSCGRCKFAEYCKGGCKAFALPGSPFLKDQRCLSVIT